MAFTYRSDAPKFYGILAVILLGMAIWHGIDGWVPQERWLERYPEVPDSWRDMGLYEFYAYNRWTALLCGIGAIVCFAISWHGRVTLKRESDILDELAAARRRKKS